MGEAPWIKGHPFRYAQEQHSAPSRDWSGWCLVFVRSCYGVGPLYPSAAEAWWHAAHKHRAAEPETIPRGVPVFWTGGSHGFGHVALSRGDGSCWTTDLIRAGKVDVAPINKVHARWGLELRGWTEDLNGTRVWEDDDMPYSKDELEHIIQHAIRTMPVAAWGPEHNPDGTTPLAQQVNQARGFAADAFREAKATRELVEKLLAERDG